MEDKLKDIKKEIEKNTLLYKGVSQKLDEAIKNNDLVMIEKVIKKYMEIKENLEKLKKESENLK